MTALFQMTCPDQFQTRFKTLRLDIPVSYETNIAVKGTAHLEKIYAGGAHVLLEHRPDYNEKIILHLFEKIKIDGYISTIDNHYCGIKFINSKMKRERLISLLTQWQAVQDGFDATIINNLNQRESVRLPLEVQAITFCKSDGTMHPCQVVNNSLTGIAIETDILLELDEKITLHDIEARVRHKTANRYGLELLGYVDLKVRSFSKLSPDTVSGNLARLYNLIAKDQNLKSIPLSYPSSKR